MRFFYSLLFYLALPFIFLRLWWRSRNNPGYRARWKERLGYFSEPYLAQSIWLHAVSVGEIIAAAPLIKALLQQYPGIPIVVTNTTPSGAERAYALLGNKVRLSYMPYDLPDVLARFLQRTQPKLLILVETELWPNLMHLCTERKIPILLTNARLSDRSAAAYQRYAFLTRFMFRQITQIAAQTEQDAKNFIAAGASAERVQITGSVKFDLQLPDNLIEQAQVWRNRWGITRPVWIAASTHSGEESQILQAFTQAREQQTDLVLILAPRHPERSGEITNLCSKTYRTTRRSAATENLLDSDILVVDTIGELLLFYAAADIAFVGGSLISPGGGHNLLEPAAVGIPVLTGSAIFNFMEIARLLTEAGAAFIVHNIDELAAQLIYLLTNPNVRQQAGVAAKQVVQNNRGALAKQLTLVKKILN